MNKEGLLQRAFSPEEFEQDAHRMVDLIAQQLRAVHSPEPGKTLDYIPPEEELSFWQKDFNPNGGGNLMDLAGKLVHNSVNFHGKGYMGHQVTVTLPVTALTSALTAYLNNCTTVYELGMAGNAMEKIVLTHMAEKYGYHPGATGVITSGGSIGNLTALVTARTSSGVPEADYGKLAIMASVEAHYSVSRAAKIMGIRDENVILVPSHDDFTVRTELLEELYQKAVQEGKIVFCVVGCVCTTSVGAYDDLNKIADFAAQHQIWFHVDAAHGGAAIFSEKYKHFLQGIERSDSLVVDFHKMMMAPPLSTAVLYNAGSRKVNEFSPEAVYLWQDQLSEEWYNSAKHTLECTKPMSVLHTYAIMSLYGDEVYQQYVDTLYDLGAEFGKMIKTQDNMELVMDPLSNIVCFRVLPEDGRDINVFNQKIAEKLLADGTFYTVSTTIRDTFYLRVTLMNPLTDTACLQTLLDKIQAFAKEV